MVITNSMSSKVFSTILGSILVLSSFTLFASGNKVVSTVTLDNYAPYTMYKKNPINTPVEILPPGKDSKKLEGYSWDVLRESYHAVGWTVKLRVTPWARALNSFNKGKEDVLWPTGKNAERLKTMNYSTETINSANFVIYVLKDYSGGWEGLKTLHGKKVGVQRGFNYGDDWNANKDSIVVKDLSRIDQGFRMLLKKRLFGFAGYDINWDYSVKMNKKLDSSMFKKLPPFGVTHEYAVCLKTNPRSKEILQAYDKGKKIIMDNGKFAEIRKKWLGN